MKFLKSVALLIVVLLSWQTTFSQKHNNKTSKQNETMQKSQIKETIGFLYDSILNCGQFKKLDQVISNDYKDETGTKGLHVFRESILELAAAFPNARWEIQDIICEDSKAVVKQVFKGTHLKQFQTIEPTGKSVEVNGIAIYTLKDGKIIESQIQTDRLRFLQQLDVIPQEVQTTEQAIYLIDRFTVPDFALNKFSKQMDYNRNFISKLSGYVKGEAFTTSDGEGNHIIMTIAVWQNIEKLDEAKRAVKYEFDRIGFNPVEFYQKLNITLERELFHVF